DSKSRLRCSVISGLESSVAQSEGGRASDRDQSDESPAYLRYLKPVPRQRLRSSLQSFKERFAKRQSSVRDSSPQRIGRSYRSRATATKPAAIGSVSQA